MYMKILLAAPLLLCASPALAADKRVYKIDSLIATQKDGRVAVQVNGYGFVCEFQSLNRNQ